MCCTVCSPPIVRFFLSPHIWAVFLLNSLLKVQSRALKLVLWKVGKLLLEINFIFSFHLFDMFLKKAVIQDPGSDKADKFRPVDKNPFRISGSVFIASVCQLRKQWLTVLCGAFLTKAAKPWMLARCSVCVQVTKTFFFQAKFSLAQKLFTHYRMPVALVIFKGDPENRQSSSIL